MSDDLKTAKDALVASLFELSKAANDVSKNAITFFNLSNPKAAAAAAAAAGVANGTSTETLDELVIADVDLATASTAAAAAVAQAAVNTPPAVVSAVNNHTTTTTTTTTSPTATPASEEKKRKKKIPKDPNAPKKPLTSYILFFNHLRQSVASENTGLSQTDIAKEIAIKWKSMSDEDKSYWKNIYEEEKVKYDAELLKYNAAKEIEDATADHAHVVDVEDEDVDNDNDNDNDEPKKKKTKKSSKKKKSKDE